MQGFNHTLTGIALALIVKQPLLVAPVALASHFVLDVIPHYGEHIPTNYGSRYFLPKVAFDALISLALVAAALVHWPHQSGIILIGVFFSLLPDAFWLLGTKPRSGVLAAFLRWHKAIQWSETGAGFAVELIWAGALLSFLSHIAVS